MSDHDPSQQSLSSELSVNDLTLSPQATVDTHTDSVDVDAGAVLSDTIGNTFPVYPSDATDLQALFGAYARRFGNVDLDALTLHQCSDHWVEVLPENRTDYVVTLQECAVCRRIRVTDVSAMSDAHE